MRVTRTIAAAIAAGCLAPAVQAQTPPATQPRPGQERPAAEPQRQNDRGHDEDHEFVRKAAEGNQKEIELGRFAAARASHADVKAFANRMVEDHTKKLAELKSVAGARMPATTGEHPTSGATAASAGSAGSQPGVPAKLATLQGAEFDRAYMDEMVAAHEDMVELFEEQSKDGDDAKLKKWAADTLPGVREHLQMARSVRDKVKGT
jgi:putative membrane protein